MENDQITVPYVSTHDNLADFFTKAQSTKTFIAMRDVIMNVPRDDARAAKCDATDRARSPAWGGVEVSR